MVLNTITNSYGASGMHLPDGSFATFGGTTDGNMSIRTIAPCQSSGNFNLSKCQWTEDEKNTLSAPTWGATAEALADGSIILLGGATGPVYIDSSNLQFNYRIYPNSTGSGSLTTFEDEIGRFNAYIYAFLMPSGNIFMQANQSSSKLHIVASHLQI